MSLSDINICVWKPLSTSPPPPYTPNKLIYKTD
ncbi:hypothetical protein T479_06490 [Lysinibacillus varians]|nr:hypothetical protein T479_06490 [Lysinibacillus varians]